MICFLNYLYLPFKVKNLKLKSKENTVSRIRFYKDIWRENYED
ncbi:hypothetical protein CNEO2_950005 [Clostridium neonatale]|uniref:Uncharacterized protein n=1 Tax=Clostridium neonatale TaxID=137838 RepID=A0AAD1YLR0_9CLOT|nr:hypothetical protein CNEO2_1020005 [Clostridium neonatale]CAI3192436.1 hypothetical protein CNEO2_1080005 [Clostridium neonatale]CAI3212264.1 hypothetical protein CNEO2_570022 [Clostridium neonatale]CAI3240752.1 hypothetical protein CNEO2_370027 [Clostridium neonatale]CAI3245138.1 hypothetical protein CNEO2_600022 [Clostridium neonatale]